MSPIVNDENELGKYEVLSLYEDENSIPIHSLDLYEL